MHGRTQSRSPLWGKWQRSCSTLAALLALSTPAHALGGLAPAGGYITDHQGRALVLHGLNTSAASKGNGTPWISATDVLAENQTMGTNAVRYLVFWDLLEPQPGQYDDNYLASVAARVAWYQAAGMYVILDMHQDLYGPPHTTALTWMAPPPGPPIPMVTRCSTRAISG